MNNFRNKTFEYILVFLTIIVLFTAVASYFYYKSDNAVGPNLITAFVGVVMSALVTLVLLNGQTKDEEKKERNIMVFEKKLRIYQDFLHCLYEVIKDGDVTEEEAIRLQFQTSFITMHTESEHIKAVAKQVQMIVSNLKNKEGNPEKAKNDAESNADNNENLMQCLFSIVEEFKKELYDIKLTDEDRANNAEAIKAFSSIMDAVEVKEDSSNSDVFSSQEASSLSQKLKEFVEKLHQRLESKLTNWEFNHGELEKGVFVNIAYKGHEEDVRVMLGYEESKESNGDHYFQVHLEHDNSHEVYKHMKWRFGGRQNKWSWWRYLDQEFRSLANVDDIEKRDWDKSLTYCETKLSELLSYVETFMQVRNEIYSNVPKDKANVWLYYNDCVAFDYEKTFQDKDKLFFDVFLVGDSYSIQIGMRDNEVPKLLQHLQQIGFNKEEQDLKEKRYLAYENMTAEEAVAKVKEMNSKLQKLS